MTEKKPPPHLSKTAPLNPKDAFRSVLDKIPIERPVDMLRNLLGQEPPGDEDRKGGGKR